ncbi:MULTISPECIES: dihydropteroate synthase [Psychrilyobacter]|uniref:dihydropteroate synthase n=1 Tax=Psychrilyobacter piezotolerans TaxID=2293438 RepID=A0ABX9KLE3_9FUSO|nr:MULTISPECIES: dihydropteroate synthase [Psychrilyobacter]MCS5421479.1 dihydropteroate synthase [Psychrilyobacter sp. S5]NDI76545.1 dihydropteroate synthase [Psychrilyobacter piezotolerans]RDE66136.1 dihydropteroate synthase [Psychrilyobacter sp. S5]REI43314.1 dihydropteroate synthase [Psychrilyobacter piezotolerans]
MLINKKKFDFENKTYTMGILNLTPDSFSDGGSYTDLETAIKRAKKMVEEGVDIIDVGAESTRPGAEYIEEEEELRRIVPVVKRLVGEVDVPISIDTYKSRVAEECIKAGAHIINDIKGLKGDPNMAEVIAKYGVPVIIMHIQGNPKNMQKNPEYDNIIEDIKGSLGESIDIAVKAGVSPEKIILDPGIGFGKTFENNLEIIKKLCEFKKLEYPILIGASRKGFIGDILGTSPLDRLEGNLAVAVISAYNGASIIRVHEVRETVRALKMTDAVKNK